MRIIGGSARGRQLAAFGGHDIRPTPDRAREALFSIITSRRGFFEGLHVLDLFAGTGALGIEALSRGAIHAWFVDRSPQACRMVRENLQRCQLLERATLIESDVWKSMPRLSSAGPFDLIFADPPYGQDIGPKLLSAIDSCGLLAKRGLLCLETSRSDTLPEETGTLRRVDERRYGITVFHLYESPAEEPT